MVLIAPDAAGNDEDKDDDDNGVESEVIFAMKMKTVLMAPAVASNDGDENYDGDNSVEREVNFR